MFDPIVTNEKSGRSPKVNPMPRHRPGESFLRGPLEWDWWSAAGRLGGSALHVASYLKQRAGWQQPLGRRFSATELSELGLGRTTALDGLARLESAGLIAAERRRSCKPVVRLTVPDAMARSRAEFGHARRPLKLPIPWAWWTVAARAPGSSLHVGLLLWFQAGWLGNEATFAVDAAEGRDLGLSRHTIGRGLGALESAVLVARGHGPGRSVVVTVLDARRSEGSSESTAMAPRRVRRPEDFAWRPP